jgi:hypothetical protein
MQSVTVLFRTVHRFFFQNNSEDDSIKFSEPPSYDFLSMVLSHDVMCFFVVKMITHCITGHYMVEIFSYAIVFNIYLVGSHSDLEQQFIRQSTKQTTTVVKLRKLIKHLFAKLDTLNDFKHVSPLLISPRKCLLGYRNYERF